MNKEESQKYLQMLGQELQKKHVTGEILIVDEIVMFLDIAKPQIRRDIGAYLAGDKSAIEIPKDINSYFGGHGSAVHDAIAGIVMREKLPGNWIYDALRQLLRSQLAHKKWIEYPGIRVYLPSPEYVLAMKVATADSSQDIQDIKTLAKKLRISSAHEMLLLVMKYISKQLLSSQMRLAIQQSFLA
ncbi:MAG: hypothetical protein M3Z24_15015 [Chloroflexota bacterium]|nr:hypothetical protein [Chloroflexota bacterium]